MKRSKHLLAVTLVGITLIAYIPAISGGFIWDDDAYVTKNPTLGTLAGLRSIWLDPSATPQYYPLVHTSFWIEHQLWGFWPAGFHLVNVLIHAINALLLWKLLSRLSVPCAWLVAMIFAVHPVHVESVAWITERKNVLSGFFYLSAALCFLRYWDFTKTCTKEETKKQSGEEDEDAVEETSAETLAAETRPGESRERRWYVAAMVCFLGALWSKTVAATLPAAILVLIWWKRGRLTVSNFVVLTPMFVLGIGFGLLTVWLEKHQVGASGIDWELSAIDRCLIAGRAIVFYAYKLVWPAELIFTYPRWNIDSTQVWQYVFPAAVLATMVTCWLLRDRIGRGPLAAICFFAGTLFPALGFFDVYPMRFSFVADHFQYLASIGIITLVVASVYHLMMFGRENPTALMRLVGVAIIVVLVALTWRQGRIYEGLEVLWRDTLAKNPTSFMAHNNLGSLLNKRGDYVEAESHLRQAVEIKPDFVDSVVNLAKSREGQGDFDEAIALYQRATGMNAEYAPAFNGLGAVYGMKGMTDLAEQNLKRALELNPNYPTVHSNLATLYVGQGKLDEAIDEFEKAIQLDPGFGVAKTNLARVYMMQQQFDRADALFKEILAENPQDVSTILNLGVVAANRKLYRTAVGYFDRVLELDPRNLQAHYNLGAMYDALGDSGRAAQYFEEYERMRGQM